MKVEIENELGISLHVDTIRNRVHEARLFGRVAPYVNKINRGKRLKFVKEMLEKLSSVVFGPTSENSTPMVWRTPREEFDPKCTVPTVKHDDGLVMVWGCFTRRRIGKLIVS